MKEFTRITLLASLGVLMLILQSHLLKNSAEIILNQRASQADPVEQSTTDNILLNRQESLSCLDHKPKVLIASQKPGSDPTKNVLEHQTAVRCGHLRRNWLRNPPLSGYARRLEIHQSNCSLPLATHNFDNTYGLGSHIILWGQAMCNGLETRYRMRSREPQWLWLDQEKCDMQNQAVLSPMLCYFPASEYRCNDFHDKFVEGENISSSTMTGENSIIVNAMPNITDPRDTKKWCELTKQSEETKAMIRASSTEYLFQSVSPLVIREAKRQIGIIFPNGVVPEDLVTVHIRWGDKFWEMDLPLIDEYIAAVKKILSKEKHFNGETRANVPTANIYLATEDPKAYREFMASKPDGWNVYGDITLLEIDAFRPVKGNRASWAARNTNGRAGLVALASLLVAMEANMFVLTTKSNWSTIMNHLRTNIINPRCGNCTKMIDLRPGVW